MPIVDPSGFAPADNTLLGLLADTTDPALGDALIGVKLVATGSVARTQHEKNGDVVSVKDFGAVGDGSTDDSAAILAAVNAAAGATNNSTSVRASVYFPPGIYLVTTTACFTPTVSTFNRGIEFYGSGWYASIIRYGTLSGATWFYDNGATSRTQFATFANLGFEGMNPSAFSVYTDIPSNAKGFKITSSAHEQGFKFLQCRFSYFDTLFDMEGTNTASEMIFSQCRFSHIKSTFYVINNLQSFDHEFYGCDLQVLYGDGFSIGSSGGGCVKWYGGYINLNNASGSDKYLFKSAGTSGAIGNPSLFSGPKLEFLGNTSNLISTTTAAEVDVIFDSGCVISTTASSNLTNFCNVNNQSTVKFRAHFIEGSTGKFQFTCTNTAAFYGENGAVDFSGSKVPTLWSTRMNMSGAWGKITGDGLSGTAVGAPAGGFHEAFDFNFNWRAGTAGLVGVWASSGATLQDCGSPVNANVRVKTAHLKLPSEYWPTTTEHTLVLPVGSIIRNIYIKKPAGSADATATSIRVTNNDKSVVHLASGSAAYNLAHSAVLTDYFYNVGSTSNEYTLRLAVTNATTGFIQGGLCIVEYM